MSRPPEPDATGALAELAAHFSQSADEVFGGSALYRALCPAVAASEPVLDLLRHRRPGQQPSYLLFGAVHYLLLAGAQHELRNWYRSLVTEPADPSTAGAAFIDFCLSHQGELSALIRARLVQTNVVRRSVALKYALWVVGQHCSQPLHLIEVGASAGLQLRVDRYRYLIGGRQFGPAQSPITIDSTWIGNAVLPDLDHAPPIASRTGIDLHPVDATDPDQRRWLRALIWPDYPADAALLERALDALAADPVTILAGGAAQQCPSLAEALPAGEPRLVYHAATRMHVPIEERTAFDNAIDQLGDSGPLYHVWLEPPSAPHHQPDGPPPASSAGLLMHGPDSVTAIPLLQLDGHGRWLAPLDAVLP